VLYLADYFRGQNIRVNALSAGLIMTTSSGAVSGIRRLRKLGKLAAPLGNVSADDVGNAALYYFSDLSTKVTGNLHFVDGGFNIMGVPNDEE
ncbi:MAG: SDR family oxidoreductase, partial [Bacteroidetes bacterium]|nr:SDR family oxidoreductase [Bacteroidota bacterium]